MNYRERTSVIIYTRVCFEICDWIQYSNGDVYVGAKQVYQEWNFNRNQMIYVTINKAKLLKTNLIIAMM